jgi:hypothetical protein
MAAERGPSVGEALLTRLAGPPDVYAQTFDIVRDAALLVQFDAAVYRAASFLDDRILRPATKGGWVALSRLTEAARALPGGLPLHFIFHTGHVGSTLVSRLLDETGGVLSLREPLPLRVLADVHDRVGKLDSLVSEGRFTVLLDTFLRLWGRGYSDTRAVLVKATSSAARIAPQLLARRGEARAIYLSLAPEPYLATLLAGQNTPVDLRGHGPERMRRLLTYGLQPPTPLSQMSLGELAAMSWLAESASAREALKSAGVRVLAVDFDQMLTNISAEMARILNHFELSCEPVLISTLAQSPVLTRYAKAPEHAYSPQLRAQLLADSRVRNGAEMAKGMAWLERMAATNAGARAVLDATGR